MADSAYKRGAESEIFWDYPKIKTFWKHIKEEIEKVLRTDILLDPLLFLLDKAPEYSFTIEQCYLILILLMTARKMITTNWMKPNPPAKVQ